MPPDRSVVSKRGPAWNRRGSLRRGRGGGLGRGRGRSREVAKSARSVRKKTSPRPDGGPGPSSSADEQRRLQQLHRLALGADKPEVERCLEELVFGDDALDEEDLLLGRLRSLGDDIHEDSSDSEVENEARKDIPPKKKPAWVDTEDEDEEEIDMTHRFRKNMIKNAGEKKLSKGKLQKRLKEEFQHAMGGTPSWAEISRKKIHSDDESDEDEDDLLKRTGNFISTSASLPRGILQMKSCLNANAERPSSAKISSVQFHPSAQVIMVAGLDNAVSLFQVDGETNPKIQSIYLEQFPVYRARFSASGEEVLATSNLSKILYVYDMMGGNVIPVHQVRGLKEKFVRNFEISPDGSFLLLNGSSGYFHLLSMKTKELIGSMKINGKAAASAFSSDSTKIYASSVDGEVYIWDVNTRKCLNKFTDEGCLRGLSIAVSRNGQYVACGSSSGVVNIYNQDTCLRETNPKPIKAIMNLVTGVTSMAFNPTTEILAIASGEANEAARLVHLPSCTVFLNFPMNRIKQISLAQTLDFSPRSGYFALGNNKGKALLYRLHHYSDF
ncbi:U3 small nucleolar RNA-associated protein 18 homolog [Trichosurus vulpecula]|uniref:U3 small nucleolar RNA-associated protein 18 homolog n=1 Tax=Trichosurus vulpecula TaxID=9337 RepID=UPI00186B192D|nr:U3 small nucleolar RNA-associated protein 18 homolog [Trichosurus vulpecula]XP_036609893.1 U3 small nucleolar RNA-associated protein 18 homolog [Trichosurus vulpecula]